MARTAHSGARLDRDPALSADSPNGVAFGNGSTYHYLSKGLTAWRKYRKSSLLVGK